MRVDGTPVDLGFAEARVPLGTHVCQIYDNAGERDDAGTGWRLCRRWFQHSQCGEGHGRNEY